VKPIDFKATPSSDGNQLECELRIKVLTSHHEDLLFKIKIQGYDPTTKEEISGIMIYTFPIKVISKPEQLKKRPPSKKRTLTDMLVETITRIERKQDEQQLFIEKVLSTQAQQSCQPTTPYCSNLPSKEVAPNKKLRRDLFWETMTDPDAAILCEKEEKKEKGKEIHDFELAFHTVLKAYNSMTPDEKPETIRRIVRNSTSRETERLSELLDLFWNQGLLKEHPMEKLSFNFGGNDGCHCVDCPHRVELSRIDDFYQEFLQTGAPMPLTGY